MPAPAPLIIAPTADWLAQHPELTTLAKRLSEAYEKRQVVDDDVLRHIGSALANALQQDEALSKAKQRCGQQALPIIVQSADPAVLSLPWEALYHPKYGFVGREPGFTLSRHNPALEIGLPDSAIGPLRVLLFTSLPDGLEEGQRLDVEAEQADVQEALMAAEQAGLIELEMPDDGRLDHFRQSLQDFQPHIVYLSGHGLFRHELHQQNAQGSFLFEGEWGEDQEVFEEDMVRCFQNTRVELLVLSACLSARQHPDYPENGLSQAFYQAGIPHVIGMRESVFDKIGIQFAKALLASIGNQQSVAISLQTARAAITQPLKDSVYKDSLSPERLAFSYGQWCLPQLLSHAYQRELIDWRFTPKPRKRPALVNMLGGITVPGRFIGRRRELRRWQNGLRRGDIRALLISGAGGTGKTALAGKLLDTLRKDGYTLFTFSLRPGHDWRQTIGSMATSLQKLTEGEKDTDAGLNDADAIEVFLNKLVSAHQSKLVLLFDNLESIQQPESPHGLQNEALMLWINSAYRLSQGAESPGLKLLLTSRWRLPDWPDAQHYALGRPVYGDYLTFARHQQLCLEPKRMRQAYETLGGNFRALEFFARAIKGMDITEEHNFLNRLQQAEAEIQTNMALAQVVAQRSDDEVTLLHALQAYQTPVPIEGIKVLMRIFESDYHPQKALLLTNKLLAVSLLEQYHNPDSGQTEYLLSPLVLSWLPKNAVEPPKGVWLCAAADFLRWQLEEGLNRSWQHRLATHQALTVAQQDDQAHQLVLRWVVGPLNRAGRYTVLLEEWLQPLLKTSNRQIRATALGQIGKQYLHLSDYETALAYLEQSLAIQQEMGDKSGDGAELNNISQIYSHG